MNRRRNVNPYYNLLISVILAISGLIASFNAIAGLISLGQGIIITLLVMGLMILLNIHIRLEELATREGK